MQPKQSNSETITQAITLQTMNCDYRITHIHQISNSHKIKENIRSKMRQKQSNFGKISQQTQILIKTLEFNCISLSVSPENQITCKAMTSGSKVVMKLENSGQLFLTRRSKLLAFHVTNLRGSFLLFSSLEVSVVSPSFFEGESAGFFAEHSFSIGLKNRFMVDAFCFRVESQSLFLLLLFLLNTN